MSTEVLAANADSLIDILDTLVVTAWEVLASNVDLLIEYFTILGTLATSAWIVHIYNILIGGAFNNLGIRPRTLSGLIGIPLAPFLHDAKKDGLGHISGNTVGFFMLGGLVLLRGTRDFVTVSIAIIVLGGLATWLLGRAVTHHGASGVIYGYGGFLLSRYYFEQNFQASFLAIVTLLVFILYKRQALFKSFLSSDVSWESHLFGFIAGLLVARHLEFWRQFF
jgi:membrane associated rhomboid family serine protease